MSNGILEIPNFQQEDAGSYECVAENSRGKNVAKGQLTFYGKFLVFLMIRLATELFILKSCMGRFEDGRFFVCLVGWGMFCWVFLFVLGVVWFFWFFF